MEFSSLSIQRMAVPECEVVACVPKMLEHRHPLDARMFEGSRCQRLNVMAMAEGSGRDLLSKMN